MVTQAGRPCGWRRAAVLAFAAGTLTAAASTNNVVRNGSFEAGTNSWTLFGLFNGTQFTVTNQAADGLLALRAAARTNLGYHAAQDVLTNLTAEGSGAYYAVEFSIHLEAPASARCTLQLADGAGSRTLILAERIVDAAMTGRWVTVRGGRSIGWSGPLTLASLRFEIGQLTERVYPAATLDRIRLVTDTDRDGLADDLDPAPAAADANTNGLPDGWEARFVLPDLPGLADSDGDGFGNAQEYWAATDPTNALSRPAQPVNSNATREARAVLHWLATLPSLPTQRVVVGQVITQTASDYTSQVVRLVQQTGRWPAMLGVVYDMSQGPINHAVLTPHATNYWNAGGLVHVQWNPDNPWTGGFSGDTNNIDFPTLFTPGSAAHSNYLAMLEEVATGLRQLGDAGLVVLFRPLCECNSVQNWFQRRARDEYIPLFRWTFDYLAKSQGLNHVLWVYDALDGPHAQVPVTYFYPGDDVVDVFGVNLYDDDWIPSFDLDRLSRDYPKPLAIPEGGTLTNYTGHITNLQYIAAVSSAYPRLSYFGIYNSFSSTVQKLYGLADNIGASNLFDHPWIITREEVNWRTHLGPSGAWQLQHFTTNANHPALGGWAADPDADGAANLFEYATGGDPQQPGGSPLRPQPAGATFLRNLSATDVTFAVEAAGDLVAGDWTPLATRTGAAPWQAGPGVTVLDGGDGAVSVGEAPAPDQRAFRLHLRLSP